MVNLWSNEQNNKTGVGLGDVLSLEVYTAPLVLLLLLSKKLGAILDTHAWDGYIMFSPLSLLQKLEEMIQSTRNIGPTNIWCREVNCIKIVRLAHVTDRLKAHDAGYVSYNPSSHIPCGCRRGL